MIAARRREGSEQGEKRYDLFTGLLDASAQDGEEGQLTDDEIMGENEAFLADCFLIRFGRERIHLFDCWS